MQSAEQFITNYEAALATQEWEQVSPLIHDDCVVTFTEGTFVGKQQVESVFRKTFDLIKDDTFTTSNIHWALKEDTMAVFVFSYSWSGIIHGKAASGSGRGTSTIVLQNDAWVLISEHLGPNPQ